MSSLDDEELVISLLAQKGLVAERFTKTERRSGKTPDFRVYSKGALVFYCEVKTIDNDLWLDEMLDKSPSGKIVGGARPDPIFNRLTDDVHKAASQFNAVNNANDVPNVLIFVNHDSLCDEMDMIAVLTGNFLAEDGTPHRIYSKFSEGRIKDEKYTIALYCWVENGKFRSLLFNEAEKLFLKKLCYLFGYQENQIRTIS